MKRLRRVVAVILAGAGAVLAGEQLYTHLKAELAEELIERAFARHLESGVDQPPWPWADTWPIASLEAPRLEVRRIVLAGSSGTSMAFGPGHLDGSPHPNHPGNCVINGHRDGAFEFLRQLRIGDKLALRTYDAEHDYLVIDRQVIDERERWILEPSDQTLLTMVTCYPFGGLTPTSRRYVVVARQAW